MMQDPRHRLEQTRLCTRTIRWGRGWQIRVNQGKFGNQATNFRKPEEWDIPHPIGQLRQAEEGFEDVDKGGVSQVGFPFVTACGEDDYALRLDCFEITLS